MRKAAFFLAIGLAFAASPALAAANTQQVGPAPAVPPLTGAGYQQLTSLAASTLFTPPVGTTYCVFAFETAPVRWRADGTAPTASVGQPQNPGDILNYKFNAPQFALNFIQQSAGAIIDATCFQ